MKSIVKGNDFTLRIPVVKMVEGEKQPFPLPSCTDIVVRVVNSFKRIELAHEIDVAEDNVLTAKVEGDMLSLGTYAVEVKGKIFGNDWRSNEYPQFRIVNNNADATMQFGETDEGDNSVEMDTALVILPPTVELSNLISDTNEALKAVKATDETLAANETARKAAETTRVEAESERATAEESRKQAETTRVAAEEARVSAEDIRTQTELEREANETTRKANESDRITSETARKQAESSRSNAEALRVSQESTRAATEAERKTSEAARQKAETERTASEQERIKAETARVAAETKREETTQKAVENFEQHMASFDEAEAKRTANENARISAETERQKAESERATAESNRSTTFDSLKSNMQKEESDRATTFSSLKSSMETEEANRSATFDSLKSDMTTATTNAQKAADDANATNATVKAEEEKRASAETARAQEEGIRQESETERIRKETERQAGEQNRVDAETARVTAETSRESDFAKAKADCEEATAKANDAASDATLAKTKAECEEATKKANQAADDAEGAEKCNVTLEGSLITVTDRNGDQKSVEVIDVDETVNLTVTSSVESIGVSGIKVNIYFNNDTKSPLQLTTDTDGKLTFTASRGEYYLMKFPEYANAQPIAPVGYTACLKSREVTVEYVPYDEETSEKVIVRVTKYTDGTGAAWQDKEVKCTYDGTTTTYTTDSKGEANIYIPLAKQYTIVVDDEDGYFVKFYNNKRSYTAEVTQRILLFNLYQFETGLYCVTSAGEEFTIDKWLETGRDASEVIAIKVADQNLMLHRSTFAFRVSDLQAMSKLTRTQWCTQNLLFESIATNGSSTSDAYYYDGKGSTFLIRQEAQERSLSVPAADAAYNETLTIGGEEQHGFMLSLGQEYVHVSNSEAIREMLRKLYGDDIADAYYKFIMGYWRWTSTQNSGTNAWMYNSRSDYFYSKTLSNYVLPAYAC